MKIFKIIPDTRNNQVIYTDANIPMDGPYWFTGESKLKDWMKNGYKSPFYIGNPNKKTNDFYSFSQFLMFNKKAMDICFTQFEMGGEILPITIDRHDDLYLFNPLICRNAVDYDKTIWKYYDDGEKGNILKLILKINRVEGESSLFTLPETSDDVFCFADLLDKEEEFYYVYHENGLTGLFFEEIPHE
jgi:hypothetical protein